MSIKLDYVDRHNDMGVKFGLDNIYELLQSLDNPHKKLKVIHIAGTNGKGSVGAYLMYILAHAKYKVGRISSPVVFDEYEFAQIMEYKEQYYISSISKKYVDDRLEYLQDNIKNNPSGFEVQIAIGLSYFLENKCDIVIVETGMGGKLDATNVFDNTLCDILTAISMDHINFLGSTIEEIANNKCGIITKEANVITTSSNEIVMDIIKKTCSDNNANLYVADNSLINYIDLKINNNTFRYKNEEYNLFQNGQYQIENAILAIETMKVLNKKGYKINDYNIKYGLEKARLKARFDLIDIDTIADGAHNVSGIKCLKQSIKKYFPNKKVIYALNIFKDKDYEKMLELILEDAYKCIVFDSNNKRSCTSDEMSKVINKYNLNNIQVIECDSLISCLDIIRQIKEKDCIVVYAGSLSFMKELYKMKNESVNNKKNNMDKEKIEEAVRLFLEGIGEDINREGLIDTPRRISNMCEEIFAGLYDDAATYLSKTFHASSNEMIIEKDITFYSVCEHHIVPFYGKAHIGYIPNGKVVGLSKLARTVEVYAKRPQIQEQMTAQIADAITDELNAKGVIVMIEAEHMCMTMRGIKKPGTKTISYATRGEFNVDKSLQDKFMLLVK